LFSRPRDTRRFAPAALKRFASPPPRATFIFGWRGGFVGQGILFYLILLAPFLSRISLIEISQVNKSGRKFDHLNFPLASVFAACAV
jgi:hypothetical protein